MDLTPIDIQQFKNDIYFLTFEGIYDNKQTLIYEQKNSIALFSD